MSILESYHEIVFDNHIFIHDFLALQTKLFLDKTLKFVLIYELIVCKFDLIAEVNFLNFLSGARLELTFALDLHHLLAIFI